MQCFSNTCKLKGVHFMTKIKKRIIIIAIPVAISAVLLLSSVFSAAKFNTFNCFSSFPAFFGIISGSENATEIDGGKIIMCPPADSVEKLASYLKDKGIERDPENDMGGRIGFIENSEKIQFASRINGYYGLFTRV